MYNSDPLRRLMANPLNPPEKIQVITPPATFDLASLWVCLIIAATSSSISITVTQTEIFAPMRAWAQKLGHMVAYLAQCFYCVKHWVVLALVLIYRPIVISSGSLAIDLAVSWFFTVTLSSLVSGALFKVFLLAMAKKVREKEVGEIFAKKQD